MTQWSTKDRFYVGAHCQHCPKPITVKNKSGYCRSCGMLGNKRTLGRKMSDEQRSQLSASRQADNNPQWKDNKVGIGALHEWVKNHLSKSELCDNCGEVSPYDLANKGIYNRDFINWEWLCRRCHMKSDGRLEKFRELAKGKA